ILEGDSVAGELGEACRKAFLSGKSTTLKIGNNEMFLNVQVPAPRIVVIGAVHISQALAQMAGIAGYDLEVIDPRTAFATPERFVGVKLSADWPQEVMTDETLDAFTALIAVTHDPKIDDYPLAQALKSDCFYVGALGSRKTHAKRLERLAEAGLSEEQSARIHAPIGLDIGASSPQEIAVAILAQIIDAFRKRGIEQGLS
ncbi:MAG: XdhC family protein, partial [Salaquimonas sp.]